MNDSDSEPVDSPKPDDAPQPADSPKPDDAPQPADSSKPDNAPQPANSPKPTDSGPAQPKARARLSISGMVLIVQAVLCVAAVGVLYYYIVSGGMRARQKPPAAETFLAHVLVELSIPAEAKTLKNPLSSSQGQRTKKTREFGCFSSSLGMSISSLVSLNAQVNFNM
jgi:hypothetical protein